MSSGLEASASRRPWRTCYGARCGPILLISISLFVVSWVVIVNEAGKASWIRYVPKRRSQCGHGVGDSLDQGRVLGYLSRKAATENNLVSLCVQLSGYVGRVTPAHYEKHCCLRLCVERRGKEIILVVVLVLTEPPGDGSILTWRHIRSHCHKHQ